MSKKIFSNVFNYALNENAKGLVIENEAEKITLNYYFHDNEERTFSLPKKIEKNLGQTLRQLLKLSPDEIINKKYCKLNEEKKKISFHLTIIPSLIGEKIIINIVKKNNKPLRLNQLGLRNRDLNSLKKCLNLKSGLIIISSPHNHGKNTTMCSLLKELETKNRSAYFIGNKIDYEFENINILKKSENNWNKLLSIDSEIIATEIINNDDLKKVIIASNSGRLVFATLPANSVWEVLADYLKLKLPLKQKINNLRLIINQRVVPLTRTSNEKIKSKKNERGEIGLFEVLEINKNLNNFLFESLENKSKEKFWEKIVKLAIRDGYEPISVDNQKKNKNGLTY